MLHGGSNGARGIQEDDVITLASMLFGGCHSAAVHYVILPMFHITYHCSF
jgi:hypothetical protein